MLIAKGRLKKTFVHYLMRLVTPSPNRDEDKPETFNAFFTSVFNTDAQSPGLEDHKTGRDKLPLDFELTEFAAATECTESPWDLRGFIPGY